MNPLADYLDPTNLKYDPYLPTQVNLPHQQYDPYGIYSIGAITRREATKIIQFTDFVAWQKYDIKPITVDFRVLVERYSQNDFYPSTTGYTFPRFLGENLGVTPQYVMLQTVELSLRRAVITDLGNGTSEWRYSEVLEKYTVVPDEAINVFYNNSTLRLHTYSWNNRNTFFTSFSPKPWVFPAFRPSFNVYEAVVATFTLTTVNSQPSQPRPPDRWELQFNFIEAYRVAPSFGSLVTGYSRDPLSIPNQIAVTSNTNQLVTLKYYRNNPYEQIPNLEYLDPEADFIEPIGDGIDPSKSRLKSIDWQAQTQKCIANTPLVIDITGIVLGTLQVDTENGLGVTIQSLGVDAYPAKYLLNDLAYTDELFNRWAQFYADETIRLTYGQAYLNYCYTTDEKARHGRFTPTISQGSLTISEGFNDHWNNYQLPPYSDYILNLRIGRNNGRDAILRYHPFFNSLPIAPLPTDIVLISGSFDANGIYISQTQPLVFGTLYETPTNKRFDNSRKNYYSFNHENLIKWQLKPQIDTNGKDRGIGAITMDSPLIVNIGAALDADKYSQNSIDSSKPRVTTLGWHIENQSRVLGIRRDDNGSIDSDKEKKLVRQVIPSKKRLDPKKIGVNCFGDEGMVVRRINNRFDKDKIESDQCVIVQDLFQLIQEYHDQDNLAFGIQESSAIEIKDGIKDSKVRARFDNQLGLLIEMFNLLSSANEMTRANLISSLVAQAQSSEIIAGLGLPSVTKTIPVKIDDKVNQVPYKGIAPHRSISQEVATCTANVGIVLGQLL